MARSRVEKKYNPAQYDFQFESISINRRRCIHFAPDQPNSDVCHCNRLEEEHTIQRKDLQLDGKWEMNTHTIKDPTKEQGVCSVNGSPYVRCDIDTDPVIIHKILTEIWCIKKSSLLMQIAGGHKYFKLNSLVETSLLDNLVEFVSQSNTWIFTDGINSGIVQLIGKALRKRKLTKLLDRTVAIAVSNYGFVKNLVDFRRPEHIEKIDAISYLHDRKMKPNEQQKPLTQNLEMNHTHYLLLDDGRLQYYDTKNYRSLLVKAISMEYIAQQTPVPTVTILFEGGEDALRSIYHDLRYNTPIIIVNNTGRLADYLVRWLSRTQEMDVDVSWKTIINIDQDYCLDQSSFVPSNSFKRKHSSHSQTNNQVNSSRSDLRYCSGVNILRNKFEKYLTSMADDLAQAINGLTLNGKPMFQESYQIKQISNEIVSMVLFCLQPKVRTNITVFNLNKSGNLQEMILRSICKTITVSQPSESVNSTTRKCLSTNHDYLLELAIDWDCITTAKEWIVQDSLDNIQDKKNILLRALLKQRHQFVHYFIQLGLQIDEVFFNPQLNPFASRNYHIRNKRYDEFISLMYTEEAINRDDWLLKNIVRTTNDYNRKVIRSTDDLNQLFRALVGGYMKPLYYDTQIEEEEDRLGVKRFTNLISPIKDVEQGPLMSSDLVYKEMAKDYIIRDLFLWSIVMNYIDLAKVFIAYIKDRICAALIATEILSHLRDSSSDAVYGDKKVEITRSIHYFEQYAIKCMDLCFKNDSDMARLLTIQRVELFGDVTCLQVADDANSKRFSSHPCCRQAENSIWYDKLHSDQYQIRHYLGLLVGLWSLGLLAPFATRFRTTNQNQILNEPTLQSNGINYCDPYANNPFHGTIFRKIHQIWQFHQSLHVKYSYHHIQYVGFLFLFSYMMLFHFDPKTMTNSEIHVSELFVILIVSCMLIEEIRHFFNQDSLSFMGKCFSYFRYFFKQLTAASFILFYVGIILQYRSDSNPDAYQAAKIIMGYDLWIWWIRSLAFITVNPYLGPHLVSIGRMLKNLSFFGILIATVMTAYGVASRSMAFYGDFEFGFRSILQSVLYPVYYLLYTNVAGELSGLDESKNVTAGFATHILLAFHMLLINILLVNLLIAMFNKSFQDVVEVQSDIWNYQQYAVVREYYDRPPFIIPFSTFFDIIALTKMFYQWYLRVRYNYASPTHRVFKVVAVQPELEVAWQEFESASTYAYAQQEILNSSEKIISNKEIQVQDANTGILKQSSAFDGAHGNVEKDSNAIKQLRQEFKVAIKDLRNDMLLLAKRH